MVRCNEKKWTPQGSMIAYECCSIYNQSLLETGYIKRKTVPTKVTYFF